MWRQPEQMRIAQLGAGNISEAFSRIWTLQARAQSGQCVFLRVCS